MRRDSSHHILSRILLGVVLLGFSQSPAAASNIVVNGSFETFTGQSGGPSLPGGPETHGIEGWTVLHNTVSIMGPNYFLAADGVNTLRAPDRSFLIITHYQRLLNHIVPDVVHVLSKGRIVKTGGKDLALELEERGYSDFVEEAA